MPVQNSEVADVFNKVADLLEIEAETSSGFGLTGMPLGPWADTRGA